MLEDTETFPSLAGRRYVASRLVAALGRLEEHAAHVSTRAEGVANARLTRRDVEPDSAAWLTAIRCLNAWDGRGEAGEGEERGETRGRRGRCRVSRVELRVLRDAGKRE